MTVAELPAADLRTHLRGSGLTLRVGPFSTTLRSSMTAIARSVRLLYAYHEVVVDAAGSHFAVRVDPPAGVRRYLRPQVRVWLEGRDPFLPLPRSMAAPMLEAALNWCVGSYGHRYVAIHAATLEADGRALLMPALPGSGKSTLCAALMARGWRLLSDEFALVEPETALVVPIPRPVALKDGSLPLIRDWAPDAVFGPEVDNNEGERVAYMRPPETAVRDLRAVPVGCVVIPNYAAQADVEVEPISRARALLHLADNSFNYNLHGKRGFELLCDVADHAPACRLRYSRLEDGVRSVEAWAGC